MDLHFDREHIWHPYSSMSNPTPIFGVTRAEGVRLYLDDGRELIDGMSSWWSALHGYNHPVLNQAIIDQTNTMAHVMFGGLTHEPAIELCKKLVTLTPKPLQKVFLTDSGSIAVEVAMKMALQYWHSQGMPQKQQLLSLRKGYHGDTFAAMSVCDPVTGMHHLFNNVLMQQRFSESPRCGYDTPWEDHYIEDFEKQITTHHQQLAAVILEPIVQGTGGMHFYSPVFLQQVRALCDQYNVLLIADEIATGFGRTGTLFGCNHSDISPDIMCLGKSITGGYMTLAATLCTDNIAQTISEGEAGVFMHGPTFMANPLACAVANANIELLLKSPWQQRVAQISEQLSRTLAPCQQLEAVNDVRVLGAIGVVELHNPVDMHTLQPRLVDLGVWIRPFGTLIYTMPPFIIAPEELQQLTDAMYQAISEL